MEIPYILLSQPRIDPDVLGAILEATWDDMLDGTKLQVLDILKDNDIKFEQ